MSHSFYIRSWYIIVARRRVQMQDTFGGGIKRDTFNGVVTFSVTARMNDRIPIGTMTGALVATGDSGIGKAPRQMPIRNIGGR